MKETLATIAERTGFSITTISRVLSGKAEKYRISKNNAAIIIAEAKKRNYTPSFAAQSLRTNKTNTIGLLLPSVANPYFANMSSVIISEAKNRNFTTIVLDSMENEENQNSGAKILLSRRVDGIIAAPCGADASMLEKINTNIPVILIDRHYENSKLPCVTTNNYKGGKDATSILISSGHKNIACIQGVITSLPNKRRVKGYLDALKEAGLDKYATVVGNNFSVQNGYVETKLLMEKTPRPTAIFALSNTIVLGAIKAIRETELKIPEDISIISFDNNIYFDYMTPAISRVSQPVEEMSKLATKLLFECIDQKKRITSHLEIAPSIIRRNSIAIIR